MMLRVVGDASQFNRVLTDAQAKVRSHSHISLPKTAAVMAAGLKADDTLCLGRAAAPEVTAADAALIELEDGCGKPVAEGAGAWVQRQYPEVTAADAALIELKVEEDDLTIEFEVEEDDPADNTLWFLSGRRLIYNRHPDAIISGDAFPAYKLKGHAAHGKAGGDG